jgi:hypothetical protein
MNLMFRMNLLSLTNFIFIKASNLSCWIGNPICWSEII